MRRFGVICLVSTFFALMHDSAGLPARAALPGLPDEDSRAGHDSPAGEGSDLRGVVEAKLELLTDPPDDSESVRSVIALDEEIHHLLEKLAPKDRPQDGSSKPLLLLAEADLPEATEYLRAVFETSSERRADAAQALALAVRLKPVESEDWQFLVRSLAVVEGPQAVDVMTTLLRFPQRATRGHWIRQVILTGLQLSDTDREVALKLLRHWSGQPRGSKNSPGWSLPEYQQWFANEYPNEPAAELPTEVAGRKWKEASVFRMIQSQVWTPDMEATAIEAFQKANCHQCHKRSELGNHFGPDLTTLGWRRSRKEIVRSLIFPSHELNEEYPAVVVLLADGRQLAGLMAAAGSDRMLIIGSDLKRTEFAKSDVEEIRQQSISNMPDGGLEVLDERQIIALVHWLGSTSGVPRPHIE
ncbi:MAG: c-type cytochrome [Planctomyces sp.]|nr:c-type cytochrome [Planctomyces sp.]